MSLQVQVSNIADKLDRVNDLLVIKKHTSDLACVLSILLLDDGVDGISNFLSALFWLRLKSGESGGIHERLWVGCLHQISCCAAA